MITAFVFIQVETHRIPEAAQEVADVRGVTEVYSCAGTIDLIAIVKTRIPEDLAEIVSTKVSKIAGVKRTDTHLAFRSFSQRDIDACFSAGITRFPQLAENSVINQPMGNRNMPGRPADRAGRTDQRERVPEQRAYHQRAHSRSAPRQATGPPDPA